MLERKKPWVRGEEDAAQAVDADGVGELEAVGADGFPDLGGGELGFFGRVKEAADGSARAQEFFPVGSVGETVVVEEGFGGEDEAAAVDDAGADGDHFDTDAGEGAAFSECELGEVVAPEFQFAGSARPEGEGEGNSAGVFVLNRENLTVLARPKLIGMHECCVTMNADGGRETSNE